MYIIILEQEDYRRIYGVFDNYIQAEAIKNKLKKYNEMCEYGELKIYEYEINKLYIKENMEEIR